MSFAPGAEDPGRAVPPPLKIKPSCVYSGDPDHRVARRRVASRVIGFVSTLAEALAGEHTSATQGHWPIAVPWQSTKTSPTRKFTNRS
jgi:hypothetical protein